MQNYNEKNTRELQKKRKEKAKLETIPHIGSKGPLNSNTSNDTDSIYYQLFEHNINALLLTSLDGSIYAANPAACNLFGRTEDDIKKIGRNGLVDLVNPRLKDAIKEWEQTGRFNGELTFIRKDGTKFPGILTSSVFNDKDGNIRTCMTIQDISEQKNTEQEVSNQKNFYGLILNNVHDGIWVTDEKDRLIYLNSEMEKIAGIKSKDVLGLSVIKDFPPETNSHFLQFYRKAKKTFEPQEYEADVVTPAGRKTVQSGWLVPRVEDGKFEGMICTIQDITEHKHAELELQKEHNLLRLLIDNIPDRIYIKDKKHRFILGNNAMIYYHGFQSEDEFIGKTDFDIYQEKYSKVFYSEEEDVIKNGKSIINERLSYKNKKGNEEWVLITKLPLRDMNGNIVGLVGITRDITEKKKNEYALCESEKKYRLLFENMINGFALHEVVLDDNKPVDYKFIEVNSAFEKLTGLKRDDILNKKVTEIMPGIENDPADWINKYGQVALTGKQIRFEDYSEPLAKWYSVLAFSTDKGRFATILEDISERKKTEIEFRESEEKYRLLVENLNEGIWKIDAKGYTTFVNSKMAEILGYSVDEMIGKHLFSFMDEKWVETAKEKIKERGNGIKSQHEFIFQKKTGEQVNVLINTSPIYDSHGNYTGAHAGISDITGYVKAMEQIKISEIRYRELFEHMPSGVAVYDVIDGGKDFIFKDFNQSGALFTKHSNKELIGKSIFEVFTGVEEFGLVEAFRKAIKSNKTVHYPAKSYKDKYLSAWYDNYIYLLPSGELVAIFTDVTQMKIAEDALHENEKLLNEVGQIAKIGGWEMDMFTRKAKWTQGTYDIVEINYGEPIPGLYEHLDYYLPEFRPKMEQAMKELIEKDIPLDIEAKGKTAKGNIKWFRAVGRAIRENGVCTKLFGTLQDITENKHAEEIINNHRRLLEKQMSLSKTLLDAIPCIAMLIKPQTREIVASNKAAIKVGAIPGKTCYETWAQRDESCPWCMAPKLWKTGEEQHVEAEYMGIVWDAYWIPVSDDLYMHFAFDITERKKYETSILQYQEQLKSLSSQLTLTEEKERYRIATHLHDHIGQYLAISRLKLVELLNSDISEGTHNTLKLVDEWLHHSIRETRSLTFDLSSPILHELGIKKAIAAWLNDEIRIKHQIKTEFYCETPQISLENDIQIVLFRNVRELLFNVVKHAHASKIKVSIKAKDNNIQIIVEDNGVGFNPAEIAETSPGKAQFGLFSIRERLEQFGGNIKIDTAPGQGCKITLTAPKKKD